MKWDLRRGVSGNERTIVRFLWLPEKCDHDHEHWLENMPIRQLWNSNYQCWFDYPERYKCPASQG